MQTRDERGLAMLYDNYSHSLFGIIVRIVRDNGLAEEILQQTFLKAWDKFASFDSSKSALFTWLSVIARNTAIDKRRLKKFENQQNTDDISDYDMSSQQNNEFSSVDVQSLLSKLDDKYKIILDKLYLQGYSQSDVANELDMPLGTVKTRLRSAINILREELKSEKKLFLGLLLMTLILALCL
jgi:RNA polymerase sigma-70 factor (ECF subfamily)